MSKTNKPKLDFIGIGAAKSGTTWVSKYLQSHPDVYLPYRKETGFFNGGGLVGNYDKGFNWYGKFFEDAPKNAVVGEFTTHYMFFETSHKLIKKHYPNIKIIACLRNPTDLAYSLYWWKKANYESMSVEDSFEEAIENNPEYIERGLFYKQLKRYFDNFPKENIMVILFDEIKNNPEKVMSNLCNFLEVKDYQHDNLLNKRVNKSKQVRFKFISNLMFLTATFLKKIGFKNFVRNITSSRLISNIYTKVNKKDFSYPKMTEKTRKMLQNTFKDDINRLERLINKDLSSWKK